MIEVVLVAIILGALTAFGAMPWIAFETALSIGIILVSAGFGFGLPAAIVYHLRLYRTLSARDALPRGWYWNPIPLNEALAARERQRIIPWCIAGGAGFAVIALGVFLIAAKTISVLIRA